MNGDLVHDVVPLVRIICRHAALIPKKLARGLFNVFFFSR